MGRRQAIALLVRVLALAGGLSAALLTLPAPALRADGAGVPRAECFPLERLPPDLRERSEALLLKALDSEALYTIFDGVKPISSGFAAFEFSVTDAKLSDLEETRRLLAAWRCGDDLYADVYHFSAVYGGYRYADGFVAHRPALARLIERFPDLFGRWGLTPGAHPMEIVLAVEYDTTTARFRGYGYLFGYPDHAVDFFVQAAGIQRRTGRRVEREFYSVQTYREPANLYAWAVPVGHRENAEDLAIRTRAIAILGDYRARRARYIGPGKPGVVELLRDAFHDGAGRYAARHYRVAEKVTGGR